MFYGSLSNFTCRRTIVYNGETFLIGGLDFYNSTVVDYPIFYFGADKREPYTPTLAIEDGISWIGNKCFYTATFTGDLVIPPSVTLLDDNSFEGFGIYRGMQRVHNLTIGDGRSMGYDVFKGAIFDGTLTLGNHAEESGVTSRWGDNIFSGCNFNNIICDFQRIAQHIFDGTNIFKFTNYESGSHTIKLVPSSNFTIENFSPLNLKY
jgi:hypothetical protein